MKRLKNYLLQKRWYRNYTSERIYLSNGIWKLFSDFKKGDKVETLINGVGTQAWCECGNELVHSDSFLQEREVKETGFAVYDYQCSHCGKCQYRNPCVMPGLHSCDKYGNLTK